MNISKNQIVMLSIGGVSLVVSAVLGYLAFDAYSTKSEAAESSESNAAAVRSLLGAAISPDPASVAAVNKNRDALAGWTEAAVSTVAAGDRVIDADVNEAAFKQKLVDEARALSELPGGVGGKIVKPDFSFGFPDFVTGDKLPEKEKLPQLQRQWADIRTLVETLQACGIVELVRIEPGIAKQPQAAAEPKDAKKPKKRKKKGAEEEKPAYTEEKYVVEFRTRPAALVKAVNALATCLSSRRLISPERGTQSARPSARETRRVQVPSSSPLVRGGGAAARPRRSSGPMPPSRRAPRMRTRALSTILRRRIRSSSAQASQHMISGRLRRRPQARPSRPQKPTATRM